MYFFFFFFHHWFTRNGHVKLEVGKEEDFENGGVAWEDLLFTGQPHKRLRLVSYLVRVVVIQPTVHSLAHHVKKRSPAVQYVLLGWHCGLGRFPYGLHRLVS